MDKWAWRLRLFASADLVGSTSFKASKSLRKSPEWAPTFDEFFSQFPQELDGAYSKLASPFHDCDDKLVPWKFSGDEILFTTVLADHREVATHLVAFRDVLRSYPMDWAKKGIPLGLKGTAWLAGFPVTNRELQIRGPTTTTTDYIGPSVDLGFRIAKFASPRRFILSADLALMLLTASVNLRRESDFEVFLHKREMLKGVIGGKPYPIVWLNVGSEQEELEEKLLGVQRQFASQDMSQYLRSFIDSTPEYLIHPFIENDPNPLYSTISEELVELREKMKSEETSRRYEDGGEQEQPTSGGTNVPKPPSEQPFQDEPTTDDS